MIIEPNYQPEPPSNQPNDIVEAGMNLTGRDLLKQLHDDLLEAVHDALYNYRGSHNPYVQRLEDCYVAYTAHSKTLEEM